jgi:tRNA(Glu) U13 pseudouridine synthase TruD
MCFLRSARHGEAKGDRKGRAEREKLSKRISRSRFNLLAIGTRKSPAGYLYEEVDYWADLDELVIGVIARDVSDDDYYWSLLARDRNGRFRSVDVGYSLRSAGYATVALRERIAKAVSGEDLAALGTGR